MRRVAPWLLLLLLGLGTVAGAAVGVAGSPSTQVVSPSSGAAWVAGVLASTAAAGTAHIVFAETTASADPALRGAVTGTGAVDFAARSVRLSEVQHESVWSSSGPDSAVSVHAETLSDAWIRIGSTLYGQIGQPLARREWVREPIPAGDAVFGLTGTAAAPLFALSPPFTVQNVRRVGPATVGGTPATKYVVRSRLGRSCPKRSTVSPAAKTAALPSAVPAVQLTTIWVDSEGRLVQARGSSFNSGRLPASLQGNPLWSGRPKGSTTTTTTLRFESFGAPVQIVAPAAWAHPPLGTSFAIAFDCAS